MGLLQYCIGDKVASNIINVNYIHSFPKEMQNGSIIFPVDYWPVTHSSRNMTQGHMTLSLGSRKNKWIHSAFLLRKSVWVSGCWCRKIILQMWSLLLQSFLPSDLIQFYHVMSLGKADPTFHCTVRSLIAHICVKCNLLLLVLDDSIQH